MFESHKSSWTALVRDDFFMLRMKKSSLTRSVAPPLKIATAIAGLRFCFSNLIIGPWYSHAVSNEYPCNLNDYRGIFAQKAGNVSRFSPDVMHEDPQELGGCGGGGQRAAGEAAQKGEKRCSCRNDHDEHGLFKVLRGKGFAF